MKEKEIKDRQKRNFDIAHKARSLSPLREGDKYGYLMELQVQFQSSLPLPDHTTSQLKAVLLEEIEDI